jgi:poly(3-hydroxybutyrate) depolymerase
MTKAVAARWGVDRSRVYAIGISAGGFEASVLGAYYPDLYAAIGIHSGAAFGTGRQGCLAPNQSSADSNRLAGAALSAMGRHVRVMPVIVVHGDRDNVIPYRCGRQALAQWLRTDNLILARDSRPPLPAAPTSVRHARVPHGRTYTVSSYADSSGCVTGQLVAVHGLAHFWSGGPRDPSLGRASGSRGPSATAASWAFFSRWRLNGPRRRC